MSLLPFICILNFNRSSYLQQKKKSKKNLILPKISKIVYLIAIAFMMQSIENQILHLLVY